MRMIPLAAVLLAAATLTGQASAVTFPNPTAPAMPGFVKAAAMQMEVSNATANLREKPTTKSKILAKLKKGTKVDVVEKVAGGKWTHVKVENMDGYISSNLLM